MAHLLPTYARTTGLRIDKMLITTQFYPLGIDEPYVAVCTSTGAPGKNYAHYRLAVDWLRPFLHKAGYKIVQTGLKDDERIGADVDVCGKTSIPQFFGVIENCALLISGDTAALHVAGHFDRKLVSLFSISHPNISKSYFGEKDNQIYLTPPNWAPSFNPNENPRKIDEILPERLINSVSNLLKLEIPNFTTLRIGHDMRMHVLEVIPNSVVPATFLQGHPLTVRFDKGGEESFVYEQLKQRKVAIATNKPLNINVLHALRQNLEGIVYLIDENDQPAFAEALQRNAFPYKLITFLDEETWQGKKLAYSEFHLAECKKWPTRESLKFTGPVTDKTMFKSNKRVLSNGNIYLSYEHEKQGKKLDNMAQNVDNVIDTPEFWHDAEQYHVFNQ